MSKQVSTFPRRNDSKPKTKKRFTVDRRRWLRGNCPDPSADTTSMLYRESDRRMCCLGFLARSCGAKVDDILERGYPDEVGPNIEWPEGILHPESGISDATDFITRINDDPKRSGKRREADLKEAFAELGIAVRFVG